VIDRLRADGRLGKMNVLVITSAGHRAPSGLPVLLKPLNIDKLISTLEAVC